MRVGQTVQRTRSPESDKRAKDSMQDSPSYLFRAPWHTTHRFAERHIKSVVLVYSATMASKRSLVILLVLLLASAVLAVSLVASSSHTSAKCPSAVAAYADGNGTVTVAEVVHVIRLHRDGCLSTMTLFRIVTAWRTSSPYTR